MDKSIPVVKLQLHVPLLEEVAKVLKDGLSKNFIEVSVTVLDCPDLTKEPFMLAEKGLCGSPRLADVGAVSYLLPVVNRDKKYDFDEIAAVTELPGSFIIGAGAGPADVLGFCCELMPNLKVGNGQNCTHYCKVIPETGEYKLEPTSEKGFMLLMNLFISEGKSGKVLEVRAKKRKGSENYMSCIRKTLKEHYGDKPVGLGGVFVIESGKAKLHVMPDFSTKPLNTAEDINEWLKFYEMSAPLTCIGHLVSHDPGQHELRMEHFHCFSKHGDGGHYHYDTTPQEVSYLGYFNVGEFLYRIDQPKQNS